MTFLANPMVLSALISTIGGLAGGLLTPKPKIPKPIIPKPPPTQLTAQAATQKAGVAARSRLGRGAAGVNVGLLGGGAAGPVARPSLLGG